MHGRLLLEDDGRHSATLAESTHPGTDRARDAAPTQRARDAASVAPRSCT